VDARGEIYWSPTGNPRRKIYFDQSEGVPVQDIWLEYRDAHNQNIEVSGYPTEKNPAMLTRIIEASSNPGDIVLDCFSGSGTTLSVASHKGRRWIGMDNSPEAISTTMRRFGKGLEPMGDFVSKLGLAEPDQESETTLSLFGPEETAKPTPKQKNSHQTIADFALIAQEPYEGDLADVLEQWMEWNGESKVPQFSEDPVPYRTGNSQKSKRSSKSRKPRR
jgi:adenine-specific DNA-methyltransferase